MNRPALRCTAVFALVLFAVPALLAQTLSAPPGPRYRPGEFVIGYDHTATGATVQSVRALAGALTVRSHPQVGIQLLRTSPQADIPALCARIRQMPGVRFCEPNYLRRVLTPVPAPNDPAYNNLDTTIAPFDPDFDPSMALPFQWALHFIQALEAWRVWPNEYYTAATKPANAVKVAVIDTGIDTGGWDEVPQPDFINAGGTSPDAAEGGQVDIADAINVLSTYDPDDFQDDYGHGTPVSSVIAAATNNGGTPQSPNVTPTPPSPDGVAGLGYNAQIMPIKAMDSTGNGTEADIVAGILWAVDHGALIINISAGDYDYSQAEQDAVNYAWEHGTMVIAAAGNDRATGNRRLYPAACAGVMAVAATGIVDIGWGWEETVASYSNYGKYIVVSAPGGDVSYVPLGFWSIWCAMPTDSVTGQLGGWPPFEGVGTPPQYQYQTGTSLACPFVAGLAALYAGYHGITQSTPGGVMQMWTAILKGCDDVAGVGGGWSQDYGWGRINAYQTMLGNDNRGATVGCITGQVYYKGTVVGNATVNAVPAGGGTAKSATSNVADGTYRLTNLAPGLWNLTATYMGEVKQINNVQVIAGVDIPRVTFYIGSNPLQVTGATYVDANHVDVAFNQQVDPTTAQTPANYSISPPCSVTGAVLAGGGTTVRLTTAAQAPNTIYTVTVSNVQDLGGTPIGTTGNTATWTTPGPPLLSWTGTPGFEDDGVKPNRGTAGAAYTFKVKVRQPDGSPSSPVQLYVWEPDGSALPGSPFAMTGNLAGNWRVGIDFFKKLYLTEPGTYRYAFDATNAVGTTRFPTTGKFWGPTVNQSPFLAWTGEPGFTDGGVSPVKGLPGETYEYRVEYSDLEGDAPVYMRVRIYGPTGEIPGSPFDMENELGSTDWQAGVVFRKSVVLPVRGMYSYRFVAHDGTGVSYLPAVGRASGPKVNNAPVLSWAGTPGFTTGGVSPTTGPAGTWFSFQVKYQDADGDAPRWVQVRVYNADTGAEIAGSPFTMTNLSGTSDWLGGVIFGRLLPLNVAGNYKYRFVASDRLTTVYWPTNRPEPGPTVTPP